MRELADERAKRMAHLGILEQEERFPVGGAEFRRHQQLALRGVAQPQQFGHGLVMGGPFDGRGGGRWLQPTQPQCRTGQHVDEARILLQLRQPARVGREAHPEVVQQECATQHERLGGVDREVGSADERRDVPQRVDVDDGVIGEHRHRPGDLRGQRLDQPAEVEVAVAKGLTRGGVRVVGLFGEGTAPQWRTFERIDHVCRSRSSQWWLRRL
jgi:hypothetical protein